MAEDYYRILNVPKDAGKEEIKKSYRTLAMKFHPDVNRDDPNSEEYFKQITEAYGVLIDPEKRRAYDLNRALSFDRDRVYQDIFSHSEYKDVFNEMPMKGEWVEKILNFGKIFAYEALVYGGRPKDIIRRGMVRAAVQGAGSAFHNVMDIHQNVSIPKKLATLGGYITVEYSPGFTSRTIRVHIPRNIKDGTTLRIQGMGRKNFMKKSGDLYLHVAIEPSS